jgi:N-methylhydantoinase A
MRIAVDTGGTHTDLVLVDERTGRLFVEKVATTPHDLLMGIERGLESITEVAGVSQKDMDEFCYATTIITNMIVQKVKVKTALLITEGFRDVLEIGRAYRKWNIYDIQMDKPQPLIPRYLVMGIKERINFRGEIIEQLDEGNLIEAANKVIREGVESIAILFFHSYKNPIHEQRAREILKEQFPGVLVSISSEVSPEFREYERASTTALNAFAQPKMIAHLGDLERMVYKKSMHCRLFMMQCNGGLIGVEKIKERPVMVSSSGPVSGVLSGMAFANLAGFRDFITFDVGGTSTDISVIHRNIIPFTIESELERYPIQIPMVEFLTIGAGGGSIVWIDAGGGLRVGPTSAGADPGPVCYNRGGTDPTTTDAMLLCNILHAERFLGGKFPLHRNMAIQAFEERVCRHLGLTWEEAIVSAARVAVSNIVEGIKAVSTSRGLDPHDFALVGFGGAGPLFASWVASELKIASVMIPPRPGLTSAFGMLIADVKRDYVVTKICLDEMVSPEELNAEYSRLEERAISDLRWEAGKQDIMLFRSIDLRYFGQSYELNVPVNGKELRSGDILAIRRAFHEKHFQVYGHFFDSKPVQYVKLRVTAVVPKENPDMAAPLFYDFKDGSPLIEEREIVLPGGKILVPVYDRMKLDDKLEIRGPCIIEQMDSTTLLLPDDKGSVTRNGCLVITKEK